MTCRVLFRADGGASIGLGHIRRVEVLSNLFRAAGCDTSFAVPEAVRPYLIGRGVAEQDILAPDATWPAVDHIVFDINWTGNAAAAAQQVAATKANLDATITVIDSMPPDHFLAHEGGWPDLLVTPYLDADQFRPAPKAGAWLHGGRHAIIDPSYTAFADHTPAAPPRILVSCGGSDPEGLTFRLVSALVPLGHPLDVVVGPLFTAHDRINDPLVTYHDSPAGLAPLIANASLVVGRVGLLRYEAASLGRHGIYLQAGEEYRAYLEGFAKRGVAEILFDEPAFLDRLKAVTAQDFEMNAHAIAAIDGKGAQRVVKAIMELEHDR